MIIPQKLADIFMEDIATQYLQTSPFSEDSEDFFSSVRHHMANKFNISWSGGGTSGSCWDTDGPTELVEEDEPEMLELENFVEKYFSDSDILYDLKLKADTHTDYENDWYGGQSSTHRKGISFYQIAEVLSSTIYKDDFDSIDFEQMLNDVSLDIIHMGQGDYDKLTFKSHLSKQLEQKPFKNKKLKI